MSPYFRLAVTVGLAVAFLVCAPAPALAYVGPGAGFVVLSSFLTAIVAILVALLSIVAWPFRKAFRLFRHQSPMLRRGVACAALVVIGVLIFRATGGAARPPSGHRVIVLGFDGMDYRITRDLMAQGRMPNFSRLAESGSFAPLASTMPPQSPVAWSSFLTGLDPGGHGIFDFVHRDPATLEPYLSTSRTEPPSQVARVGSWQLPLSGGSVTLLRDGQPFWEVLEHHGVPATIIRMPANYPPSGSATRELSGMGTPDLIGTYGTFAFFTSASPARTAAVPGGRIVAVDVVDHIVRGELVGPDNPFRSPARPVTMPFTVYVDAARPAVKIVVAGEERVLQAGEWSDWVPIAFPLAPFQTLPGMARFYVKQVRPTFELYVSPLNLDPLSPALPISSPASYAADMARASGRFYTQGLADDTKALNAHVLTRDEFLRQAADVHAEVTRQYEHALGDFSDGFLFYYFGHLDQLSHMLWRARDPEHPAYDATRDAPYAAVIDDTYVAFDRIVGETMRRAGPDTTIVVVSDHGFSSWRRSFNLNSWLRDQGYLTVRHPSGGTDAGFEDVDWSKTRAYGLGLNGLYINVRGRERSGVVGEAERRALVEEIRARLMATVDPATGRPVVTKALLREEVGSTSAHFDRAPDLFVGYAAGTRVSNESAVGSVPATVFANNTQEWSGDHCMDPDAVPGILLTSWRLREPVPSIDRAARAILAELGFQDFPGSR